MTIRHIFAYPLSVSPNQKCSVTLAVDGKERRVEIAADSLYEAGALAIEAFRDADPKLALDNAILRISVGTKSYSLPVPRLKEWLTRTHGTDSDFQARERIYRRIYEQYSRSLGYETLREFREKLNRMSSPEDFYRAVHANCHLSREHFPPRRVLLELIYAWKVVRDRRRNP